MIIIIGKKRRKMPLGRKKGQAALEFLMTYGWAILVVLITIGALSYFGVLSPTILLPERCSLQTGLQCNNWILQTAPVVGVAGATNHSIYLELQNGMGKGIIIRQINITGTNVKCGAMYFNAPAGSAWNDNQGGKPGIYLPQSKTKILSMWQNHQAPTNPNYINCTLTSSIGKQKADVAIQWHFEDATATFTHTMYGDILANIEVK